MYLNNLKILIFLCITYSTFGQVKEVRYYDENWKLTTKENATFYRDLPLEEKGDKELVKDYYISGVLQMVGWVKKGDSNAYDGEIKWFYENGNPSQIINYKNGYLEGEYKQFHKNGKLMLLKTMKKNNREGISSVYKLDGTLVASVIFKNDKPYEGVYILGSKKEPHIITYKKGLKIIEEVKYDIQDPEKILEDEKTIAKGFYKEGKPYEGKFVTMYPSYEIGSKLRKITTLKDGKEEGKQVVKYLDDKKPYTYYYAKDGVKQGESYIYDDKSDTGYKLHYKKGKPFKGELFDEDKNILVYKKGELIKTKKRIKAMGIEFFEIYKKEEKIGVENLFFEIDGSKIQRGTYKNEKPYNGYFLRKTNQFPILDYYKKGVKKYQYSKGYIDREEGSEFETLKTAFKSTYKNNKIFSGTEFISDKDGFSARNIEKGKATALSFWVFAIHYGNNVILRKKENKIELTEYNNPNLKITISKNEVLLIYNNELIEKRRKGDLKNKEKIFYTQNGTLESLTHWYLNENNKEKLKKAIRGSIIMKLYKERIPNIDLDYFLEDLDATFLEPKTENEGESHFLGRIVYNENGKAKEGILVTQNNNTFSTETYLNTKLKESKTELSLEELKSYVRKYYEEEN